MVKTPPTRFDRMVRSLPECIAHDPLSETTESDLEFLVQHEIDITESSEDGTSRRWLPALRKWLAKWGFTRWA